MDTIANMLTAIRNGYAADKESVFVPYSKLNMEIAKLLQKEGFVKNVAKKGRKFKKILDISLLYKNGKATINQIKRVSKPSRRVYASFRETFPTRKSSRGIKILTTSKGIMADKEARKEKVGGEIIAEVW
ncbi:30S ribosomal protein S8 [Patescibacteria group bacterium]|nr:30S ribosomal protein S8 [Patescibacteria group bacterium]